MRKGQGQNDTKCLIFGPSDGTALKQARVYTRNHCTSSGTLPLVTACGHSSLCHPQMQVKALSCREAICEHDPETLLSSLGQRSFKMGSDQAENCSEVSLNI